MQTVAMFQTSHYIRNRTNLSVTCNTNKLVKHWNVIIIVLVLLINFSNDGVNANPIAILSSNSDINSVNPYSSVSLYSDTNFKGNLRKKKDKNARG